MALLNLMTVPVMVAHLDSMSTSRVMRVLCVVNLIIIKNYNIMIIVNNNNIFADNGTKRDAGLARFGSINTWLTF